MPPACTSEGAAAGGNTDDVGYHEPSKCAEGIKACVTGKDQTGAEAGR